MQLAVDDFGTGYSSLQYLRGFPIDILKIAKSFIDGVAGASDESALARAIIDLGESFQLRVVAEGIEQRRPARRGCCAWAASSARATTSQSRWTPPPRVGCWPRPGHCLMAARERTPARGSSSGLYARLKRRPAVGDSLSSSADPLARRAVHRQRNARFSSASSEAAAASIAASRSGVSSPAFSSSIS